VQVILDRLLGGQHQFHSVALPDLDLVRAHGAALYGEADRPLARGIGGGSAGFLGAQHSEQHA
jgi:hypothetical protein